MKIDWAALGLVALVSLVATVVVVTVTALGVASLGAAQDKVKAGQSPTGSRIVGWICVTIAGACVLYGIYLIIPALH